MPAPRWSNFREITPQRADEFLQKGYKSRHFFPHRVYHLPKAGPDALKLSYRMCGEGDPNKQWEVILNSAPQLIDEFPQSLFFDDDIIWHQQQFGQVGHIAFAYLVIRDSNLYGLNYVSDVVQRISRRKEHRTRIEKKFRGWHHMLFNGIMNFALEKQLKTVYSPTADLALENTDPKRVVQRALFDRVYDKALTERFLAVREEKWWVIDVEANRHRIVIPERRQELLPNGKTICVCHDIEKGMGHLDVDPAFARFADQVSPKHLDAMLSIEAEANLKATYNVVGTMVPGIRKDIEEQGHCIGFHSYNHKIAPGRAPVDNPEIDQTAGDARKNLWLSDQLNQCRRIDYRIKGYRPPQSKITADISDDILCFHNFEWLASSVSSLGFIQPKMVNRIVKIPILFDDFDLYKRGMRFDDWADNAINIIRRHDLVAFSLHDCYGEFWLPFYRRFLDEIRSLGEFKTLTEVSNAIVLSKAE